MKQFFRHTAFRAESQALIRRCNDIIEDYRSQGLRLTLRQLYYQLVSANEIKNEEKSYKSLGSLVSNARLSGLMDWEAIEDRVRRPRRASQFDNLEELVDAALHSYRLPRWEGQEYYVELWVEKDALAGVLEPIANEYHVTLMVNRGYSSQSAMYESGLRFRRQADEGKKLKLLYLGDHDPSGEDMVRDVRDRLQMFLEPLEQENEEGEMEEIGEVTREIRCAIDSLDVHKIALTMPQIRQYGPPPNPAKMSDSRARAYVEEHGHSSWEVDALPPQILAKLIRTSLADIVDKEKMDAVRRRERIDKEDLRRAVQSIMGK